MMKVKYRYTGAGFQNRRPTDDLKSYTPAFLTGLLRSMLRIRIVEEQIAAEYHKDEIKNPVHLVIGQEATAVGLCSAMKVTDLLYLTHRTHGGYLAKGGDLKAMMSELYCKANGQASKLCFGTQVLMENRCRLCAAITVPSLKIVTFAGALLRKSADIGRFANY